MMRYQSLAVTSFVESLNHSAVIFNVLHSHFLIVDSFRAMLPFVVLYFLHFLLIVVSTRSMGSDQKSCPVCEKFFKWFSKLCIW